MKNSDLARDYVTRAGHRLAAVEVLYERKSYADVVRESQEIVELCLKGLLRLANIEVPRIHDVGGIVLENCERMPVKLQDHLEELAQISHDLRRDRELAYYGSEDLTPSEFYKKKDAKEAFSAAKRVYSLISKVF